mgnify:CR=1 FL=1
MNTFFIGAAQLDLSSTDNFDLLIQKSRSYIARFPYLEMLVFSELAVGGGNAHNDKHYLDRYFEKLSSLASELDIWLVPGSFYEKTDKGIFNTSPVFNNKGELVAKSEKVFPFLPYEIDVNSGSEVCVFEIPNRGLMGIQICYDLWFPETSRALAVKGAEVILHPSLTDTCDRDLEKSMVRATAVQQQCYYIDVNSGGSQGCGQSMVVGPEGEIIHEASIGEELMLIEVDFDKVRRVRERGVKGLGQPLKSFRDNENISKIMNNINKEEYLSTLGKLKLPKKEKK